MEDNIKSKQEPLVKKWKEPPVIENKNRNDMNNYNSCNNNNNNNNKKNNNIYSSLLVRDIHIKLHSYSTNLIFLKIKPKEVIAKLRAVINKYKRDGMDITYEILKTPGETIQTVNKSLENVTDNITIIQMIKKTKLVGFRDRILLQIFPKNNEHVIVQIYSRSIDQNVYTALCNCEPQMAYYACCCGLFPSYDYGENKRFVFEFVSDLDHSYIFLEEDEVNQAKNDAYNPPTPPIIHRDSFGWDDNTSEIDTEITNVNKKVVSRNNVLVDTLPINERLNTLSSQLSSGSDGGKNSPSRGYIKVTKQNSPDVVTNSNEGTQGEKDTITNDDEEGNDSNDSGNAWFEL